MPPRPAPSADPDADRDPDSDPDEDTTLEEGPVAAEASLAGAPGLPWARYIWCHAVASGRRADVYLSEHFPRWSRTKAARYIEEGLVRSETRPSLKPSTLLREGERLRLLVPGMIPTGAPPPLPPIVYEDDRLLVFNKPAGMLVHPAGERFAYALIGLVKAARPGDRMDLVHRLDRDTSGVLVLTKDREANAALKHVLKHQHHRIDKQYLAITRGVVPWEEEDCHLPVGVATGSLVRLRRGVIPDGDASRTTFRVVQRLEGHTLVACRLHTGRTHQIRVHLEALGYPLLGDKLYGQPDEVFMHYLDHGDDARVRAAVPFPRQALHAWRITLPHPDGHEATFEAPLTPELQAVVDGAPPGWPEAPAAGEAPPPLGG